jgi:hypothetical protein
MQNTLVSSWTKLYTEWRKKGKLFPSAHRPICYAALSVDWYFGDGDSYRGADKSLARPTSRYVLFDGENISFDVSLVLYIYIYIYTYIYIYSTNIPPIMIINRKYENQNLLSL